MHFRTPKALILALGMGLGFQVSATENGGSAYPHGAETWMTGMLPPSGLYYLNYTNFYAADQLNGPRGDVLIDDFRIRAFANVSRFVYVTDTKIFGADLAVQALIPLVNLEVDIMGQSQTSTGLGDIVLDPFILGWHFDKLHIAAGIDIIVPSGQYDANRLANIGRNYYTFEPAVSITYHDPQGMEFSVKLMYDTSTKNDDTNYQSGDEFHFDFAAGWNIDNWSVGVAGYYDKQLSDDKQNGLVVGDGNRGEVFAIGPSFKYQYGMTTFLATWHKEFNAENRPEGDKLWINFIMPL